MQNLYTALRQCAHKNPEALALVEYAGQMPQQLSFSELLEQIDRTAKAFWTQGIRPTDKVGLMLLNQTTFFVCLFALRKIGAVVVPINIQMLPQDIAFVISNAGLRLLVVHQELYTHMASVPLPMILVSAPPHETPLQETPALRQSWETFLQPVILDSAASCAPETKTEAETSSELAFLIYTSGTSGHPKGVMLSEQNLLSNIEGFSGVVPFSAEDRLVLALPLFHSYGLIIGLCGLLAGARVALIPKFHPKSILQAVLEQRATVLPLVPTFFSVLLQLAGRGRSEDNLKPDFSALRFCVSGGASLPATLLKQIEAVLGAPVLEGYGLTETSPVIAVNDPAVGSVAGSVGKPLPNVMVRIAEDAEIQIKGPNVMLGYYGLPEATAEIMTPDGWLKTGDLGYLDEAGRLFINGHKKELIIKAGENLSPRPIEDCLHQHPAVHEVAVLGIPDARLGEAVVACISLKEEQTDAAPINNKDLLAHCRQHLNPMYIPDKILLLPELPKNATGKILKKVLKAQLMESMALS